VSYNKKTDYKNYYLRALNIGVRSANGFLAIQAKDKEALGGIIRTLLPIARALGVEETLLKRSDKFRKLAEEREGLRLRRELGKLKTAIESEMKRMGDDEIALLMSTGGWLEGLRAVTDILRSKYDKKASDLLRQPGIASYLGGKFKELDPDTLNDTMVKEIADKIPEIEKLINVDFGKPVPKENVEKLFIISNKLVKKIERG
jgi:hypothetical protein